MFILKHLKTLQHVSIVILIIFRENNALLYTITLVSNVHIKTLQHVSIVILIIFRENNALLYTIILV